MVSGKENERFPDAGLKETGLAVINVEPDQNGREGVTLITKSVTCAPAKSLTLAVNRQFIHQTSHTGMREAI